MSGDEKAYFFYLLILLVFIGGGFLYGNREKLSTTLMQAAIWVLIFAGVLIGYGFKDTLQQQFAPSRAVQHSDGYEIVKANDGHFYLTLEMNGQDVLFVVDTGASDIVLSQQDAARIGIELDALAYLGTAQTANGTVRIASTIVDRIVLGELVDDNVRVSVNGGEMFGSLLGMRYLNRFSEIAIRGDRLILRR